MTATGALVGIGVGPGDPDLITVKGLRALRAAPVLAYPAPETGESLARAIVAPHLDGTAKTEIPIRMPMVAARFPAREVYDRAARTIGGHLDAGRDVACLCEGDPFFYGSFSFLFERMVERYPVRVIPGVSSLTACAAAAGAPLATRNDVLAVVPATLDEAALRTRLGAADAVAIIKVGRHLAKVRGGLDSLGLLAGAPLGRVRGVRDPLGLLAGARYVERATMERERRLPLAEVDGAKAPYFSMVLVHRRGFAWN